MLAVSTNTIKAVASKTKLEGDQEVKLIGESGGSEGGTSPVTATSMGGAGDDRLVEINRRKRSKSAGELKQN